MPGNSHADFTNWQVLVLTKKYPGEKINSLVELARQEMPSFYWNYFKVRNAANRLAERKRISIEGCRLWPIL